MVSWSGLTSVGSGSLIIAALMIVYPRMSMRRLVGTDLVQAVPLVASAAVAHMLLGEVHFGLTASLLLGSIPGVYLGAHAVVEGLGHGPQTHDHGVAHGLRGKAARRRATLVTVIGSVVMTAYAVWAYVWSTIAGSRGTWPLAPPGPP